MSRRTFKDFVLDKKRGKCKVCQLPAAVKKQLKDRNPEHGTLDVVFAWLKTEWNIIVTHREWDLHQKERHAVGGLATSSHRGRGRQV